jgi:predicted metal-dependent enzyme (double-stranded beta helix superfamily)
MVFSLSHFISQCRLAAKDYNPANAVAEVMAVTVADPAAILDELPASGEDEILLHHCAELTIYRVLVYHGLEYPPHEHGMQVVIGLYAGCETNLLYRRRPEDKSLIERTGRINLTPSRVMGFGADIIHSVCNRAPEPSAALHVYLGDLHAQKRSLWTLDLDGERPFDMEHYFAFALDLARVKRSVA